jgi:hypothetical protein
MKPLALRLFVFAVLLVFAAAWTKEGMSLFFLCIVLDFLEDKENCHINANAVKIMKSSESTMSWQLLKVLT